jgi:cytochrome P450
MILPNLYGAHHDHDVWGDPEIFRPERFITSDGKFSKPGEAFMPFSVGKRVCIGESLARNTFFLFLANISQRFKIIPDPDKPTPIIDYIPSFVMQPKPYDYLLQPREA